jgi:hypothetical protein
MSTTISRWRDLIVRLLCLLGFSAMLVGSCFTAARAGRRV